MTLLLLLVACGGLRCEVGTGDWEFEPLRDGDEVPIIFGPQGGWHIYTSVRFRGGSDAGVAVVTGDAVGVDDGLPLGPGFEGWSQLYEGRGEGVAFLNLVDDGESKRGREILLRASVADPSGEVCTDEVRVFTR